MYTEEKEKGSREEKWGEESRREVFACTFSCPQIFPISHFLFKHTLVEEDSQIHNIGF